MNFEGENISLRDALFVDNITGDLENFRVSSSCVARVLVFPPVNNYHRFLIHKVVETGFPQFTTFSVGEGIDRRTVVCFQQHLLEYTLNQSQICPVESVSEVTRTTNYNEEKIVSIKAVGDVQNPETSESTPTVVDVKNPLDCIVDLEEESSVDITLVDPGASSSGSTLCENKTNTACEVDSLVDEDTNEINEMKITAGINEAASGDGMKSCGSLSSATGTTQSNVSSNNNKKSRARRPAMAVYVPPRGRMPTTAGKLCTARPVSPSCKSEEMTEKVAESSVAVPKVSVPAGLDATEQVVNEITVAVGGVQIQAPQIDYLAFQTSDSTINIDQFGHVIELYDFPSEYRTVDLVNAFPAFTSRWDIKWVDDTHALGVFSSSEVAAEALAVRHPSIMTRPLNMATPQSKCKARSVLDELLPYKPRPVSCTAPARRLLQWALGSGMRVPEASKLENERLMEARRRKEEGRRRDGTEERKKRREDGGGGRVCKLGAVDKKLRHDEHDHR